MLNDLLLLCILIAIHLAFSGLLTFAMMKILEQQEAVDDPTASSAVHMVGGVVGTIATGLFVKADERCVIPRRV